jgi:hypothetical protein
VTRRSLIRRAFLLLGINPVALVGCASRAAVLPVHAASDPASKSGALSDAESEDLLAFAEALLEGRMLTPTERRYLLEHLEDRTRRSPRDLWLYRTAATVLARVAGRRFASLELRERIELIVRHRLASPQVWPGEELGPFPDDMRTLRTLVVPDLVGGYYASPAGWQVVGYEIFPGRCADLTRYTHPEG